MKSFNLFALLCVLTFISCEKETSLSKTASTLEILLGKWQVDSMWIVQLDGSTQVTTSNNAFAQPGAYVEFKADSTFIMEEVGFGYSGRFTSIDNNEISLLLSKEWFGQQVNNFTTPKTMTMKIHLLAATEAIIYYQMAAATPNKRWMYYHLRR